MSSTRCGAAPCGAAGSAATRAACRSETLSATRGVSPSYNIRGVARTKLVALRLSEEEHALLTRRAEGRSLSDYIRGRALGEDRFGGSSYNRDVAPYSKEQQAGRKPKPKR